MATRVQKAGQGQGSIRQLGRDLWRVRAPVIGYTPSGSPIQPSRRVRGTKADAVAVLDGLRGARRAGTPVTTKGTVGEYLARWLNASSARWSATHARRQRGIVTGALAPLASVKLRDLSVGHLGRLYADLSTAGAEPATVRRVHAVISRALADAVAMDVLGMNVATKAQRFLPTVPEPQVRAATTEEAHAILAGVATESKVIGDLVSWAACTGLRRSELCALQWRDIDTATHEIVVNHGLDYQNRATWSLKATKPYKVRRVPLTVFAEEVLDRRSRTASSTEPTAFVFSEAAEGTTPIDPDRVSKVAAAARDAAGIDTGLKPVHGLRGWFCTEVGSMVSVKEAQALLGYQSIRTSERYLARRREDTVKAAAAIDAALRSPEELPGAG